MHTIHSFAQLFSSYFTEILLDDLWLRQSVLTLKSSKQLLRSLSSIPFQHSSLPPKAVPTARSAPCGLSIHRGWESLSSRPPSEPHLLSMGEVSQIAIDANKTNPMASTSHVSAVLNAAGNGSETFQLSSCERQQVEWVFHVFAENQEDKLSQQRLGSLLQKLGLEIHDDSIESLIASLNVKVPGYLDIDEFVLLYCNVCNCLKTFTESENGEDDALFDSFLVFDKNKDGYISCDELQDVLSRLGFKEGENARQCQDMLDRVDEDGDGKVNFQEFKKMMSGAGRRSDS